VVVGTFLSSFVTLGTAYSFGAFFSAMADEFDSGKAATSVVFGVTTFAFFWLSILTGRLADRVGPRPVLLLGACSLFVGLLLTSRAGSLPVAYATYGVGVGVAAATGYIPMVAAVGGWFEAKRATAVGIAVAGIGVDTLVMSPLAARLVEAHGWRDTYRFIGIAGALVLLACIGLVDRPPGQRSAVAPPLRTVLESPIFRWLHLSALCSGLALFVPFVFVGQYAEAQGVSAVRAAVLVGLLGGSSVLARIGFGSAVRRFGSMPLYRGSFVLLGSSFLLWLIAGSSYTLLVAFVVVLGVGYGGFVALSTIVMAERMGVVGLGAILGHFYTSQGLGGLVGPPVAGLIIDATGGYTVAIVGCIVLEVAAFLLLTRVPDTGVGEVANQA